MYDENVDGPLSQLDGLIFHDLHFDWQNVPGDFVIAGATLLLGCCGFRIHRRRVDGDGPEPATLALLGLGLAGFGYQRRRKPVFSS